MSFAKAKNGKHTELLILVRAYIVHFPSIACSDRRFIFIIAINDCDCNCEAAFAFAPLLKRRKEFIKEIPMKTFRYGDGDRGEVLAFVATLINLSYKSA